jgi:hypothetical protein
MSGPSLFLLSQLTFGMRDRHNRHARRWVGPACVFLLTIAVSPGSLWAADMVVKTTIRFCADGNGQWSCRDPTTDPFRSDLKDHLHDPVVIVLSDGRALRNDSDLNAQDGDGDGSEYRLIQTSLTGPDAWDFVGPPLTVAVAVAGTIEPELSPAALALGTLVDPVWLSNDASTSQKLMTLPPELQGPAVAAGIASAAKNLWDLSNWAIDLGTDRFDRSIEDQASVVIDKSVIGKNDLFDHVWIVFHVDTHNGDNIGWVRSAPIKPGAALMSGQAAVIMAEDRHYGPKEWSVWVHLHPKLMPVGVYNIVLSAKETNCQGCLSTVHRVQVAVLRSCISEGMVPSSTTGSCDRCGPLERVDPISESCISCGPRGFQDYGDNDPTQCVVCAGNQIRLFIWIIPLCVNCPIGLTPDSIGSACICNSARCAAIRPDLK